MGKCGIFTTTRSGRLQRWLPLRVRGPVLEPPAQLDVDLSPATPTLGHVDLLTCVVKVLAKTVSFRFCDSPSQSKSVGSNTEHTASYPVLYMHVVCIRPHGHTTHTKTTHTKIKFKKQSPYFLLCTDETPSGVAVSQPVGRDPRLKNPFTGVT